MSEEKWIDDALSSLEDADRAKAPTDVFEDIEQQIAKQQLPKPKYQWMAVAAIILLVVCSNVLLLDNYLQEEEISDYPDEYPEVISNYTLYEDE